MTVRGLDVALALLERANKRLVNPDTLLQKALIMVFQTIQRKFDSAGADDSSNWAMLKPATLRWKLVHDYSPLPLVRSGDLRQQWDFRYVSKRVAVLGSRVDYGMYHEMGTRTLPQRQISPQEARLHEIGVRVGGDFAAEVTAS